MQSAWRVACVRIPRFPIGALWDGVAVGGAGGKERAVRDAEPIGLAELTESVRDATAWMHWAPTTDEAVEASVRRLVTHGCLEWTADGYTHCWPRWAKLMGLK